MGYSTANLVIKLLRSLHVFGRIDQDRESFAKAEVATPIGQPGLVLRRPQQLRLIQVLELRALFAFYGHCFPLTPPPRLSGDGLKPDAVDLDAVARFSSGHFTMHRDAVDGILALEAGLRSSRCAGSLLEVATAGLGLVAATAARRHNASTSQRRDAARAPLES